MKETIGRILAELVGVAEGAGQALTLAPEVYPAEILEALRPVPGEAAGVHVAAGADGRIALSIVAADLPSEQRRAVVGEFLNAALVAHVRRLSAPEGG